MRNSFANVVLEEADKKNLLLVTGDLGFGVFEELQSRYPDNFLNAGITEQSLTSLAAGLADTGWVPIIYSIANFPTLRNLEQIRNDIAYPNRHVVVCAVGAGLSYSSLGYSHFALEDLAVMRSMPNFRILSPSDPHRAALATRSAITENRPTYLRLGKNGEKDFGSLAQAEHFSIREISSGRDEVAVASTGSIGSIVVEAIATLNRPIAHYSIEEVWPLRHEILDALSTFKSVLVVEEHGPVGGLFGALAEAFQRKKIKVNLHSIHADVTKLNLSGDHTYMRDQAGLSPQKLAEAITLIK